MFAHFTQGSNDLPTAIRFYDALLTPLNISRRESDDNSTIVCYQCTASMPSFFVVTPYDNNPATAGNGCMIAFSAESESRVDLSYKAGIAHGGKDEGPPGERLEYAAGYYGAYLRDPDGNKIHIVYRGDLDGS